MYITGGRIFCVQIAKVRVAWDDIGASRRKVYLESIDAQNEV